MCMNVYHIHACCPESSEEGIGSPKAGVMDGCVPSCGFWELNPGPLQEQVLLTAEPPLHPFLPSQSYGPSAKHSHSQSLSNAGHLPLP